MAKITANLNPVDEELGLFYPNPVPNISYSVPHPPKADDPIGDEVVVREGYVNKNEMIAELRRAGQNLTEWKEWYYYGGYPNEGEPDETEDYEEVTSRHDFDFDDAARYADALAARMLKRRRLRSKEELISSPDVPSPSPSPDLAQNPSPAS